MNNSSGLIDSNILIYANLENSPFYRQASDFINKEIENGKKFALALQNLVEFYAVLTNSKLTNPVRAPQEVSQKIQNILNSGFYGVIFPNTQTPTTLVLFLEKILVRGAEVHDVNLAATAISNGINTIYTADPRIFKKLGLTAINPLT